MKVCKLVLLCGSLAILATGCLVSASKLTLLSLGMNKQQVMHAIGKPTNVRAALKNKFDQTIEIWEYEMDHANSPDTTHWLYFCDDKLARWNEAGDWQREADRIYEIRFNPKPQL